MFGATLRRAIGTATSGLPSLAGVRGSSRAARRGRSRSGQVTGRTCTSRWRAGLRQPLYNVCGGIGVLLCRSYRTTHMWDFSIFFASCVVITSLDTKTHLILSLVRCMGCEAR
jgi:hypothetical protein